MSTRDLVAANHPAAFWRFVPDPPAAAWDEALSTLGPEFDPWAQIVRTQGWDALLAWILAEEQFGPRRYRLGPAKRLYYSIKPLLPRAATRLARRAYRSKQEHDFPLAWPLEDRYARFLIALGDAVASAYPGSARTPVWPGGARSALVLTHDIETKRGQDFVREVAGVEESLGFRSSFNFVPERYPVDRRLQGELRERGFEIGVHGLKHDGKLFLSRGRFERRAQRINAYLAEWGASGFRAPLTHRHPEWLQGLDIDYDLSFFDTDPYEPMAGGVMTPWPFFMGRFVELPYTLPQDYTLLRVLGETTPAIWLAKAASLRALGGMVLLNSHPDYLETGHGMEVYAAFLRSMGAVPEQWRALPRDVAAWWSRRAGRTGLDA